MKRRHIFWLSAVTVGVVVAAVVKYSFFPATLKESQITAANSGTTIIPVPYTGDMSADVVSGAAVPSPADAVPTHVVEADDNGKTTGKGYMLDGVRVGVWTFYHPNGKLCCHGEYEQGKCVGTWTFYHPNGTVRSRGAFQDGYRMGIWSFFYETGELKSKGEFDDKGEKQGLWVNYNTHNMKRLEGSFLHGKRHGLWRGYPSDDKTSYWEGEYDIQGRKTGTWIWYKDGQKRVLDQYHEDELVKRDRITR